MNCRFIRKYTVGLNIFIVRVSRIFQDIHRLKKRIIKISKLINHFRQKNLCFPRQVMSSRHRLQSCYFLNETLLFRQAIVSIVHSEYLPLPLMYTCTYLEIRGSGSSISFQNSTYFHNSSLQKRQGKVAASKSPLLAV